MITAAVVLAVVWCLEVVVFVVSYKMSLNDGQ